MELAMIAMMSSALALQAASSGQPRAVESSPAIQNATGPIPIPGHSSSVLSVNPDSLEVPVDLPIIEPRVADPPSLPWDDVGDDSLFAQGDRFIELHVPDIYIPKQEVDTEPPHIQRNPVYPDDLRAYDTHRSRNQAILQDPSNRNYTFGGYHIPYLAQNSTHQEVSQSYNLAGRRASQYTSGAVDRNMALGNLKEPTASVVRQQGDHYVDDRSFYQPHIWQKKQQAELVGQIQQQALATRGAINQPTEWVDNTRVRATPKYLNPSDNLHGYATLSARDQRADGTDYNALKMKRLLLVGDQGFPSSQVAFYGGYDGALKYPMTGRTREIMPPVTTPGLFQHGTGRAHIDHNTGLQTGNTCVSQLETREVMVPHMNPYTNTSIGRSLQQKTMPPYVFAPDGKTRNPTTDFIKQPVTMPMFYDKGEPFWWADNVSIDIPLHR